ncbi:MAG: quinone-interacting membrane-bound oxidoreductase complex subunit QmoC [Thermodesulfovibrionales bacterium]|nr:quinone-interacting membrane-bound oxidoreductase complex subunit QmoC [Thermodesulfovibrionales bacterium]
MAEQIVKPDLKFINDVIAAGGESLKKCFQCATCSVVCNVTPDDRPFPRKEMVHAQWGLKDRLFANPDIWLCHQCSDCTAYCPRGAKPGEVLGAVRKLSLQHYSTPGFLAKMVGDPKFLVLLLAVPAVIFLLIITYMGNLNMASIPRGEEGGIVYAKFIPVPFIDAVFIAAATFAAIVFVTGVLKYWKDMSQGVSLSGSLGASIIAVVTDILSHKRFRKCDVTKGRSTSHMLVFFSFVGLAITTTIAVVYIYGLKWESPYPLSDPMKILGNASAAALLLGLALVIINRLKNVDKAGIGSYYDWLFIGVVTSVVVTGVLSELLRLGDIAQMAYPIYFIHLVTVFFLFAYAPFSKMAHMVYRATAMVFAKQSGRE